jgi:hypothetical protein
MKDKEMSSEDSQSNHGAAKRDGRAKEEKIDWQAIAECNMQKTRKYMPLAFINTSESRVAPFIF